MAEPVDLDPRDSSGTEDGSDPSDEPSEEPTCQEGWLELLDNPSFDEGPVGWRERGLYPIITDEPAVEPHSPSFVAELGGYRFARNRLWQSVRVPDDAIALRARAHAVADVEAFLVDDGTLAVDLSSDEDDGDRERLYATTASELGDGWSELELSPADPRAGAAVRLIFAVNAGGSAATFAVDTVSLEALVCR